jgi:glycerol-3-phosphate dehydrogenase
MATSLIDLVSRRTRAHLHDARATVAAAPEIARLVAPVMGWSESETVRQIEAYRSLARHEFAAAGLAL